MAQLSWLGEPVRGAIDGRTAYVPQATSISSGGTGEKEEPDVIMVIVIAVDSTVQ